MSRNGLGLSVALGLLAFAIDRLHKYVQVGVFHWPEGAFRPFIPFIDYGLTYNTGISYGLLGSVPPWMIGVLVVVAMVALLVWWIRTHDTLVRVGLALCLGGAVSNAIDRLIYPGVVDSFWLHFGDWSLFIFNIADASISLGVLLLFIDFLGFGRSRAPKPV